MQENGSNPDFAECRQFPETVRLLWEGTQQALNEWGMDHSDLVSLCDIILRLAEHRLLVIAKCVPSAESRQAAERVQYYLKQAQTLRQWAATPPAEPDWAEVERKLHSA